MRKLIPIVLAISVIAPFATKAQDVREANFQFKQDNYPTALKLYLPAYKKDTGNVDIAYAIGICKIRTNAAPAEALPYLLKAEPKYGQTEDFQMALIRAYLYNQQFDKARELCSKAEAKFKSSIEIDALKAYIGNAEKMIKKPLDVTFVNLGKGINSEMDEITPMLTIDNELLLYSSNRKYDTEVKEFTWDVLHSASDAGDFKKNRAATGVNTVENEIMAGLSVGSGEIYFQQEAYGIERDIIMSGIENGTLKGKNILPPTINTRNLEQGATSTASGDTMIFSSAGLGGQGGLDLFYSVRLPNGDWCAPTNLGSLNTKYDESYPMLSADCKKLYFCSNGLNSMGGYDIFVCDIDLKTFKTGEPKNIGYPLNDMYDNLTISYTLDGTYAYVSAIRPDSYGYADIYRVVFNEKDPMVKMYIVKLVTQQGDQSVDFGETDTNLKISVLKNKTLFGTYNYNPAASNVVVALLPGNYTLEIEGATIEPFTMKINVPNAPGKKIENTKAVLKIKK